MVHVGWTAFIGDWQKCNVQEIYLLTAIMHRPAQAKAILQFITHRPAKQKLVTILHKQNISPTKHAQA